MYTQDTLLIELQEVRLYTQLAPYMPCTCQNIIIFILNCYQNFLIHNHKMYTKYILSHPHLSTKQHTHPNTHPHLPSPSTRQSTRRSAGPSKCSGRHTGASTTHRCPHRTWPCPTLTPFPKTHWARGSSTSLILQATSRR